MASKLYVICAFLCHLNALPSIALASSQKGKEAGGRLACQSIDDLDFEQCDVSDLPLTALREICVRLGLNVEKQVFPYLFGEDDEGTESQTVSSEEIALETIKERSHADYVLAAKECLSIENEMEDLLETDEEQLLQFERDLLGEDPELLADIMADVLAQDPQLLSAIEKSIQRDDPELFKELLEEMGEDDNSFMYKSLKDRPDLVAEFILQMLMEDPSILNEIDESGMGANGLEGDFQLNEEEVDDEGEEEFAALKRAEGVPSDEL